MKKKLLNFLLLLFILPVAAKAQFETFQDSVVQLYGVVIYKTIILSIIYRIVGTTIGFYLFIILPLLFIIGSEILSTMLNKEEERRKKISNNI